MASQFSEYTAQLDAHSRESLLAHGLYLVLWTRDNRPCSAMLMTGAQIANDGSFEAATDCLFYHLFTQKVKG